MSPSLIAPTTVLYSLSLKVREEIEVGTRVDGPGVRAHEDVDSPAGFAGALPPGLRLPVHLRVPHSLREAL